MPRKIAVMELWLDYKYCRNLFETWSTRIRRKLVIKGLIGQYEGRKIL